MRRIIRRLSGRAHLILLANASLPDDPATVVPVSFKVAHEIMAVESDPKLADLVARLRDQPCRWRYSEGRAQQAARATSPRV